MRLKATWPRSTTSIRPRANARARSKPQTPNPKPQAQNHEAHNLSDHEAHNLGDHEAHNLSDGAQECFNLQRAIESHEHATLSAQTALAALHTSAALARQRGGRAGAAALTALRTRTLTASGTSPFLFLTLKHTHTHTHTHTLTHTLTLTHTHTTTALGAWGGARAAKWRLRRVGGGMAERRARGVVAV